MVGNLGWGGGGPCSLSSNLEFSMGLALGSVIDFGKLLDIDLMAYL